MFVIVDLQTFHTDYLSRFMAIFAPNFVVVVIATKNIHGFPIWTQQNCYAMHIFPNLLVSYHHRHLKIVFDHFLHVLYRADNYDCNNKGKVVPVLY
jgi:hypothetical protein